MDQKSFDPIEDYLKQLNELEVKKCDLCGKQFQQAGFQDKREACEVCRQ